MDTVSIAIVSHGDQEDVIDLLTSFEINRDPDINFELILLENLSSQESFNYSDFGFPIKVINNKKPAGLAKNINTIFQYVKGNYFCIINPDIVFNEIIFLGLINSIKNNDIDIIAPLIMGPEGKIQDSFRNIPNPFELIPRYFGRHTNIELPSTEKIIYPEWLAGMFLFMKSELFHDLGGYNEKYFL